jgi:hypothetical protein
MTSVLSHPPRMNGTHPLRMAQWIAYVSHSLLQKTHLVSILAHQAAIVAHDAPQMAHDIPHVARLKPLVAHASATTATPSETSETCWPHDETRSRHEGHPRSQERRPSTPTQGSASAAATRARCERRRSATPCSPTRAQPGRKHLPSGSERVGEPLCPGLAPALPHRAEGRFEVSRESRSVHQG